MGFVRRRARRRTALVVGGAAYAAGRHRGRAQESDAGGYDEPDAGGYDEAAPAPPPAAAPAPAAPSASIDYDRARAAREAARRRHPDRRGVRGRQGQGPRRLTHAIAAMRSRVPEPTGRLPELVVEDSPDAGDLALLEEQVAAAATAAAGLGDEQEFGIFGRDDDGRVVAGISAIVWGGYCELQAMWVEASLRNRGLAHALFAGGGGRGPPQRLRARRVSRLRPARSRSLRAARIRDGRRHRELPGGKRCPLVPQGPVSALRPGVPGTYLKPVQRR